MKRAASSPPASPGCSSSKMEKMDSPSGSGPPALPGSSQMEARNPLSTEMGLNDLPQNILLEIFSRLPCQELILNCRLVCSKWRDLVDSTGLWKRKLEEWKKNQVVKPLYTCFKPREEDYYIFGRLEKNLIKNPSCEEGMNFWEIGESSVGQWEIQTIPEEEMEDVWWLTSENNKFFKTSKGRCVKSQRITLSDHGYWEDLVDTIRPEIIVEDTVCSFSGNYELTVQLLSDDNEVLQQHVAPTRMSSLCGIWQTISHTFSDYPRGVRHIVFQHQGGSDPEHPTKITRSRILISRRSYYDTNFDYNEYFDYGYDEYPAFLFSDEEN